MKRKTRDEPELPPLVQAGKPGKNRLGLARRELKLKPELEFTQNKMSRVREWREKNLPCTGRQIPRKPEKPRVGMVRPELEITQDKMERVREWRQKKRPIKLVSTLQDYDVTKQFKSTESRLPYKRRFEPTILLTESFLNPKREEGNARTNVQPSLKHGKRVKTNLEKDRVLVPESPKNFWTFPANLCVASDNVDNDDTNNFLKIFD